MTTGPQPRCCRNRAPPRFRSRTDVVTVSVAVKKGNDPVDNLTAADGPTLLDASKRSEAVLHYIYVSGSGDMPEHAISAFCTPDEVDSTKYVEMAAQQSGGARHRSIFGDPTVRTFARILTDFRQSYILRYSAAGVARGGWHRIRVEVPGRKGVRIDARSGYYGAR